MQEQINQLGLARQPIFDQHLNVVAYELLYQSEKQEEVAKFLEGDQEACDVLINNFTSIYDSGAMKSLPAFLNVTENFIRTDSLPNLSRHNLVIDLKQQTELSKDYINSLHKYVDAGYRLVLDDFTYDPIYDDLLRLAKIVRVDISDRSNESIAEHMQKLNRFKVTVLAENVNTYEEYERCQALGFKLFQGTFLSRPSLVEGKKLTSNQAIVIHLLAALQDQDVTPHTLADITSRDPQLTFKLLRIVNSAQYNLPNKIESLTQAIVALGINEIKKWATLLALSSNDDKPSELIRQILITARMCEYVAHYTDEVDSELAFMTGVLSMLDALLEVDQPTLLDQLSVSEEIVEAITRYEGKSGKLLQAVNFYMIGQSAFRLPPEVQEVYAEAYYEGVRWSNENMQMMQGSHL
ncbi:EAL and HDOD domain-containing protein [Neptuniibacter caesariensis]|uniref:Diguanylate phosphodiesterase (EAL domain) n=1 Tax=Neptuniibacter caesariensis TaxID=207954 RepID=A0A7U8C3B9_NEPCE|nr:HDOD domain-containing protein [Neptuniibacter caesariensis]EAR60449.1 diguanylate phosphodiesterase (EAL domain) [Oceanospirillum sp. MED92] [Neptuniibacter caesariensis]